MTRIVGVLGRLIPRFLRERVLDLRPRLDQLAADVRSLDAVVDALVLSPTYEPADGVGFNGQVGRKAIFRDLLNAAKFDAIVETGTWLGNTAAYMAETSKLPVYSCEINPRFHGVAKMRLAHIAGVHLRLADSRDFLREMSSVLEPNARILFYLDAHWYEEVLKEELDVISRQWHGGYVVMIDDFAVPGDPGYEFDDYGPTRTLALKTFATVFTRLGLIPFFPTLASNEETGRRRGCVVLARRGDMFGALERVPSLALHGEACRPEI